MNPTRPAFTLIELLVVITIIAILAAILMPTIGMVKKLANQSSCSSRQKQLALAIEAYRVENEAVYPLSALHDWGDFNWPAALTAPYSPYAYDSYWGNSPQPFLWGALMNYDIIPPVATGPLNGTMAAIWRCPARQRLNSGGGRPYMIGTNAKWHTNFRWNYVKAANSSGAKFGVTRARLLYDYATPDWAKSDFMHADGTTNVIYADLHAAKESYDTYRTASPTATHAGEVTNAWSADGWTQ